jgi:sec-independent protein translocase protein TatA
LRHQRRHLGQEIVSAGHGTSFWGYAMGSFSLFHWLVVLVIVLLLFGAGKLPRVMGDFAKGIKAFKAGMKEEDEAETPAPQVPPPAAATTATATAAERTAHDRG